MILKPLQQVSHQRIRQQAPDRRMIVCGELAEQILAVAAADVARRVWQRYRFAARGAEESLRHLSGPPGLLANEGWARGRPK